MPGASGGSVPVPPSASPQAGVRATPIRWSDLRTRILSALVVAPAALLCVWLGSVAWWALVLAAGAVLAWEWGGMERSGRHASRCPLPFREGVGGGVTPAQDPAGAWVIGTVTAALLVAIALPAGWGAAVLAAGVALTWTATRRPALAAGVLYIGTACLALLWLRGLSQAGRADVFFLVLIVSASDIGAYAAGRLLGGPKLAPAISPGKTWSGAGGGLAAAILVGQGLAWLVSGAPFGRATLVAALLGIAAQFGDLLESWVKRQFGVKDSGRLLPGHGGLLDRLDGLLIAAPAAVLLYLFVQRGVYLWQ